MIEFRPLASSEIGEAVALWEACGLTSPRNDPLAVAQRALKEPSSTIIGAFANGHLIGTAMAGRDGDSGRISHLGVERDFRRWGVGRKLIRSCEDWLFQFGVSKVQLMARIENSETTRFCKVIGYQEDTFHFFSRRLRPQI